MSKMSKMSKIIMKNFFYIILIFSIFINVSCNGSSSEIPNGSPSEEILDRKVPLKAKYDLDKDKIKPEIESIFLYLINPPKSFGKRDENVFYKISKILGVEEEITSPLLGLMSTTELINLAENFAFSIYGQSGDMNALKIKSSELSGELLRMETLLKDDSLEELNSALKSLMNNFGEEFANLYYRENKGWQEYKKSDFFLSDKSIEEDNFYEKRDLIFESIKSLMQFYKKVKEREKQ
jgi:hypothetical protein